MLPRSLFLSLAMELKSAARNLCSLFDLIGLTGVSSGAFRLVSSWLTISFFALKLTVDKLAVT